MMLTGLFEISRVNAVINLFVKTEIDLVFNLKKYYVNHVFSFGLLDVSQTYYLSLVQPKT